MAGLKGGSGKTTLSIGITRALRDLGLNVVCFKKGPDYIDAGWLAMSSGRDCYNLDSYLIPGDKTFHSFCIHSRDADIAIVEGNRGLYDGVDARGTYSTAELAKILKSPVLLILDCAKVTRTMAPIVQGLIGFDSEVAIRGVILNNIFGQRHETVIRDALDEYTDVRVIGALRRLKKDLPERHMGLTPHHEHPDVEKIIESMGRVVREDTDIDALVDISRESPDLEVEEDLQLYDHNSPLDSKSLSTEEAPGLESACPEVRIGIIRDTAFQFYYPENFSALTASGAEVVEISAIDETALPDVDALYIGGGFPETNAIYLSENRSFMASLKDAVERGLPVYAECGGLMYLGREIEYRGRLYRMSGVLPLSFVMDTAPSAHGYTVIEVSSDNPFFEKGTTLKGHEFHYSRVTDYGGGLKMAFRMKRGKGITGDTGGVTYKNVLATYTHLHALGSPQWSEGLVAAARRYSADRVLQRD